MPDRIVKLTYFKRSGTFYSSDECSLPSLGLPEDAKAFEIVERVRVLRDNRACLPGLASSWPYGFVVVECAPGEPCLLYPAREIES